MKHFGLFYGHSVFLKLLVKLFCRLVYFLPFWYVVHTKKNLATLLCPNLVKSFCGPVWISQSCPYRSRPLDSNETVSPVTKRSDDFV
jgi:hypothetical protein